MKPPYQGSLQEYDVFEKKDVMIEMRDGINPKRRISLRLKGRKDLPLTRVGQPLPMDELEKDGAKLARFLNINLEGL